LLFVASEVAKSNHCLILRPDGDDGDSEAAYIIISLFLERVFYSLIFDTHRLD